MILHHSAYDTTGSGRKQLILRLVILFTECYHCFGLQEILPYKY